MRLFHLADLHIGKKINNVSLLEDQQEILAQVLAAIEAQKPDVLILAGDVYDRRMPPVEAVNLLDEFLSTVILKLKIPVLAIGGNHDSGERLNFANGILAKAGLHVAGRLSLPLSTVVLEDQWGKVNFHLLPYGDLATINDVLANNFEQYPQAMAAVLATMKEQWAVDERHVLIAHGIVIGGQEPLYSESERDLSIGGTENWGSELLNDFDYVALGHLHRPQQSGRAHIRYAGSLLKYSFSEEKQRKVILQVDLGAKGDLEITEIPLKAKRDMRTIEGELDSLLLHSSEDYIRAVLTDKGELLEPMAKLKTVYPNILELRRSEQSDSQAIIDFEQGINVEEKPEKLFAQFYQQLLGEEMSAEEESFLWKIIENVQKEAM